ncbi:MAG: hypothetical protein ACJAZW_001114 [Maritalea sp.]|jgi:hypothetical protein
MARSNLPPPGGEGDGSCASPSGTQFLRHPPPLYPSLPGDRAKSETQILALFELCHSDLNHRSDVENGHGAWSSLPPPGGEGGGSCASPNSAQLLRHPPPLYPSLPGYPVRSEPQILALFELCHSDLDHRSDGENGRGVWSSLPPPGGEGGGSCASPNSSQFLRHPPPLYPSLPGYPVRSEPQILALFEL